MSDARLRNAGTDEIEVVFLQHNAASILVRHPDNPRHSAIIAYSLIVGGKPGGFTYGDKVTLEVASWLVDREGLGKTATTASTQPPADQIHTE